MTEKYDEPFNNVVINRGFQKGGTFIWEIIRQNTKASDWLELCKFYKKLEAEYLAHPDLNWKEIYSQRFEDGLNQLGVRLN